MTRTYHYFVFAFFYFVDTDEIYKLLIASINDTQ